MDKPFPKPAWGFDDFDPFDYNLPMHESRLTYFKDATSKDILILNKRLSQMSPISKISAREFEKKISQSLKKTSERGLLNSGKIQVQ